MQAEELRCALVSTAQSQTGDLDPPNQSITVWIEMSADSTDLKLFDWNDRF